MVAGWDQLLPSWFTRLHERYRTPVNSILFVGAITLAFAIASQIGTGAQEAFQMVDNAATVFYGIAYVIMFAVPLFGARQISHNAPWWVRGAAACGLIVSILAIVYTIFPIVDVRSQMLFALKIIAVTIVGNGIGAFIFSLSSKRSKMAAV
jgi:amino acid transporter